MVSRHQWLSLVGALALVLSMMAAFPAAGQEATPAVDDGTPVAGTTETGGTLGDRICPVTGPIGEVEGESFYCGLLYVPENWNEPKGRQIQITYAVLKSTSLSPLPDPVIYLEGGPGGSAIEGLAFYGSVFKEMRRSRDVILFDQRGTKYSTRLDCDPYQLAVNYLIENDEETQEIFADILASDDEELLGEVLTEVYMSACAEGMTEAGYDLSQYNSIASVKDLFALTNALGYDEVNLYGISYGTRLALTAMRDHPEQIRSVVLDSTYPLQIRNLENMSNLLDEVLVGLVATCEATPECNEAYPDFGEQLGALISVLADDPESLDAMATILSMINQNPPLAAYIPLMVETMLEGDMSVFDAIVEGDLPPEVPPSVQPGSVEEILLEAQDLQASASDMLSQAALDAQDHRPGALWVSAAVDSLGELPEDDLNQAAIELVAVPVESPVPSVEALETFVRENVPAADQEPLIATLGELSPLELQYVYDLIGSLSDELTGGSDMTDGMYFSVECSEEVPYNDLAEAEEIAGELAYPELGPSGLAMSRQIAATCEVWPTGQSTTLADRAVQSDIPTLILSGAYDVQTPPSWNRMALEGLSDVTLVEVPASGHGVIMYSTCASNIATSFVSSPGAELSTSCVADLEPDFVTPEEYAAQSDGPAATPNVVTPAAIAPRRGVA